VIAPEGASPTVVAEPCRAELGAEHVSHIRDSVEHHVLVPFPTA